MELPLSEAVDDLRSLGTVPELLAAARNGRPAYIPNNAHLHLPPNFSAFSSVEQAMDLAAAQNCRIVGASNYYDYTIYGEFARAARRKDIFPLFGMEIICMIDDMRIAGMKVNDPGNPGKMYICGKGIIKFANMSPAARNILDTIRSLDAARMSRMVDRLSLILTERGMPNTMTADAVIDRIVRRLGVARETIFLQERHVAQFIQEYFFAKVVPAERMARVTNVLGTVSRLSSPEDSVGLQNELRAHLMKAGRPGYVEETFVDFAPAMTLIAEMGGFASYPVLADGNGPICPFEEPVSGFIGRLRERRIYAAELITGRNRLATVAAYARALRAAGLIVTAGTEHNTLELIPFAPVCLGGDPLPADLQAIFHEGACVIAAHQFLVAQGETGYVDADGNLNAHYTDDEERITAFAKLGDTVIRRYLAAGGRVLA